MNEYQKQYVIPKILVEERFSQDEIASEVVQDLDLLDQTTYAMGLTVEEMAQAHGLKDFDTALPSRWINHVRETIGFDMRGHVVWSYDRQGVFGVPFAITRHGRVALSIYEYVVASQEV